MMVSLVIVVIFIAMFTTSLTIYGMNGESLNGKIIGINKYSSDIVWIKTENSVAVGQSKFFFKELFSPDLSLFKTKKKNTTQ
jgi:hypothetical protein